jgi:nucleotidyltransferase/DNA polymerase involved in DNA repair
MTSLFDGGEISSQPSSPLARRLLVQIRDNTHVTTASNVSNHIAGDLSSPSAIALSPDEFVRRIRKQVYDELGITASAGLAHNMLLARMCTRKAKPNGILVFQFDFDLLEVLNLCTDRIQGSFISQRVKPNNS